MESEGITWETLESVWDSAKEGIWVVVSSLFVIGFPIYLAKKL